MLFCDMFASSWRHTLSRVHNKVCADTDVVEIFSYHLYAIFLITQPLTPDRSSTTRSGNK
jgi:hypothetical protein